MENKVWKERHIYFGTEQEAIIAPNETFNGVVLTLSETMGSEEFSAYLSYQEAIELGRELMEFAKEKQ